MSIESSTKITTVGTVINRIKRKEKKDGDLSFNHQVFGKKAKLQNS